MGARFFIKLGNHPPNLDSPVSYILAPTFSNILTISVKFLFLTCDNTFRERIEKTCWLYGGKQKNDYTHST